MIHAQFTLLTNKLKFAPRGQIDRQIVSFIYAHVIQMLVNAKMRGKNLRITLCLLLASYHPAWLIRHLHIIHKSKIQNYTRWTGLQPVKPQFCYLDLRQPDRKTGWIPYTKQSTGQLGTLIGENPLLLSPVNFQAPTGGMLGYLDTQELVKINLCNILVS